MNDPEIIYMGEIVHLSDACCLGGCEECFCSSEECGCDCHSEEPSDE